MLERKILRGLWILGLILVPTLFKKPKKDRWLVFLLNSLFNVYLDNFLVATNRLKYPVRIKNASLFTRGSILYDTVLCPIVTTWYYSAVLKNKNIGIFLLKTLIFVSPQIIVEIIFERYTNLVDYKNGWKWYHSFFAVAFIKMVVVGFVRLLNLGQNTDCEINGSN